MPEKDIQSLSDDKSEEIIDIVEKMPVNFGRQVTCIVLFIFILLFIFSWIIRYPDVVKGQIVINATTSPIKIVANYSGKISLLGFKSRDSVHTGDYIGVLQNSALTSDIRKLDSLLSHFDINANSHNSYLPLFSKNLSLGELNLKYFTFLDALYQIIDYQERNILKKQEEILKKLSLNQRALLNTRNEEILLRQRNLDINNKAYSRDSFLHEEKVVSTVELERATINRLASIENYKVVNKEIITSLYEIEDTQNKLEQLDIQRMEKEKQMKLLLFKSYYDLIDEIRNWEQKYVLKAPMDGYVEYLEFWQNNQYVQSGIPIFSIVPKENKMVGQVFLPGSGSGKVTPGQKVIIKLDNYPYAEYGSINGIINTISLVTNNRITNPQKNSDDYLVSVELPEGLKTNYDAILEFKYEIKGTAEIITKDRKLIERLFDNLKYDIVK